MRLIDADTLYDKAEERYKNAPTPYRKIYRGFVDDVADAPTVDAAPVVHGRWKYHKYVGKYECMECLHFVKAGTERNYCPNCGAKMDLPGKDGAI